MNAATLELDDRREVWVLLKRLEPRQRVAWLRWCCTQVRGPDKIATVRVTSQSGTVKEVYYDAMLLCFAHGLDLGKAVAQLVEVVRRLR